jgi:hypothetical protein
MSSNLTDLQDNVLLGMVTASRHGGVNIIKLRRTVRTFFLPRLGARSQGPATGNHNTSCIYYMTARCFKVCELIMAVSQDTFLQHCPPRRCRSTSRPWYRDYFEEHPGYISRNPDAFSGGKVNVWCKQCLEWRVQEIEARESLDYSQGNTGSVRNRDAILRQRTFASYVSCPTLTH